MRFWESLVADVRFSDLKAVVWFKLDLETTHNAYQTDMHGEIASSS